MNSPRTTTVEVIEQPKTLEEMNAVLRDRSNYANIPEQAAVMAIWPLARISSTRATDGCFSGQIVYSLYLPEIGLVTANCLVPRHAWKAALNHARFRGLAPAFPNGEERVMHPSCQ